MLEFSRLKLSDAPELRPLFTHTHSRTCEYVFSTLLLWRDMWPLEYAVYGETVFIRIEVAKGQSGYMLPVGGDLEQALSVLDSHHQGQKLLYNVPPAELEILKLRYSSVIAEPLYTGGDYLYDADSMATVKGRKLHGQRNHLNYFERTWEHRTEEITDKNARDVKAFFERTAVLKSTDIFQEGANKTFEVLENLDVYRFSSLALYAEGKVIGATFGTLLGDTLYVTIEQADRAYRGVYPKLSSAFVSAHINAGAIYVNREDDLGDDGLRKSKLAWNPCRVIEKFSAVVN
jgi:hypothetical protein